MGLDICLYHFEDFDRTLHLEREVSGKLDALQRELVPDILRGIHLLKRLDDLTPDERERLDRYNAARKRLVTEAGLLDPDVAGREVEFPSERHPENEFRVGYWHPGNRNEFQLNAVLRATIGRDLYDAFPEARPIWDGTATDSRLRPDWWAARERLTAMLGDLRSPEAQARLREHRTRWPSVEDPAVYEAQLDVVLETVEYVLSRPDPERYILDWS